LLRAVDLPFSHSLSNFAGRKGNLTERSLAVAICLVFSLVGALGAIYYLLWQTYVLRCEVILVAIQLVFIGFEVIFSIVSMVTFAR
jgi:transmembrane protein 216